MAVYDVDPFYADRFAEFANEKEKTPFTAVAFGSIEKLRAFLQQQPVEILLAGGNVPEEELADLQVGQVIRLSEDGRELHRRKGTESGGENSIIYKYQSSDAVLREVMACYRVEENRTAVHVIGVKSNVIGVYSPVGSCGKTGFCLTLGQAMAENRKVLYINLEDFSGLSVLTGSTYHGSLSDLVYYFRQGEYSRVRLDAVLYSWGSLDYVPPAAYAEDLEEIRSSELAGLIMAIANEGIYDVILLDMGHLCINMEPLLELCSVVYAPMREDCVSAAKMEEWKTYMKHSGREHLWERVQILRLPEPKLCRMPDAWLEQLRWGEMGDFVRNLLYQREEGRRS
jgi:cellulose biosynthesis protein BcsQ